jgi:hypothetical protein
MLLNFSHDRSNWSPSFSSTTFHNLSGVSDLLPEASMLRYESLGTYYNVLQYLLCFLTFYPALYFADVLAVFERKILRKIYGPVKENELWRILWNDELEDTIKGENTFRFIKSQRIRWLGHIERMQDTAIPKSCCMESCMQHDAEGDQIRDGWMTCLRTWERWE